MTRAKIVNGRWTRKVPWVNGNLWRTDIFKTTLADSRLKETEFILSNGLIVIIPAYELRRILTGGSDHYDDQIWGPFNINPVQKTINGHKVQMEVI
jgi:hypothetical protein